MSKITDKIKNLNKLAHKLTLDAYMEDSRCAVSSQETGPTGLYFSPDGTKMFVTGSTGDDVNRYDLSTPWDINTAVYTSVTAVGLVGDTNPGGLHFKSDGTKMYVLGITGDAVRQFTLNPAWDITTAVLDKTFSYLNEELTYFQDIRFNPTGTKMYLGGSYWSSETQSYTYIAEYTLATAWDIGSPTFTVRNTLASTNDNYTGFDFSHNGTKIWAIGSGNDCVYEFNLATAYDLSSTTTYVGMHKLYQYVTNTGQPLASGNALFLNPANDSSFWVLDSSNDAVSYFKPNVQTINFETDMMLVNGRIRSSMPITSDASLHAKQYVMSDWGFATGNVASPSTSIGYGVVKRTSGNGTQYGLQAQYAYTGTNLSADRPNYGTYTWQQAGNQNAAAYSQNLYGGYNVVQTSTVGGNSLNGEGNMFGVYNYIINRSNDPTYRRFENMYGTYNYVYSAGNTSLTDQAYGTFNYIRTGGTYDGVNNIAITTAYGNYTSISASTANRGITTAYGHYFTATETGGITTKYTFYDSTTWAWRLGSLAGTGNRAVYSDAAGILTNSSSDATLKTNVETITYGIDTVMAMNPVFYNWIDTEKRGGQKEIGYIAQEMQQVVPEVIGSNADGTLSLDYPKLVAVLTKAIQEQQSVINDLKTRIETLENK